MNKFSQHLERIKATNQSINKMLSEFENHNIASASISCLWEVFLDTLFVSEGLSVSDLNTLSGVFQKLISSDIQIKDNGQYKDKIAEQQVALQKLREMQLSSYSIKRIEEQLKLI